jgi:flavin-dependent dehydrogenase
LPHDATDIFLRPDYCGGYAWLFPKGAVANVGVGISIESRKSLKPLLDALCQKLAEERRIGTRTFALTGGAIPVGGRLRSIARLGRTAVLLAGDAAGLTNPVTGAGIASAVQSGALAGSAAIALLAGRAAALDEYGCCAQSSVAPPARRVGALCGWRSARCPRAERWLDLFPALLDRLIDK